MKKTNFIITIAVCSVFFITFLTFDEEYIPDHALQQIYEGALLAILLGTVGVIASKYYGDETADTTIKEVEKSIAKLHEKIEKLESKFDKLNNKDV